VGIAGLAGGLSGCSSCQRPSAEGIDAAADATGDAQGRDVMGAGAAGDRAHADAALALAAPSCRAVVPGGRPLAGKLEPGQVTVAVAGGRALVINTLFQRARARATAAGTPDAPLESAKSERVVLASSGLPDGPFEPIIAPHGPGEGSCCALTWAAATRWKAGLASVSYGTSREGSSVCRGGTLLLEAPDAPIHLGEPGCRFASSFAAAGLGDLAVAFLDGPTEVPREAARGPAVADAILHVAGKPPITIRLEPPPSAADAGAGDAGSRAGAARDAGAPSASATVDAPAAAVGSGLVAVAFRVSTAEDARALHVARIQPNGILVGAVEILDRGAVGAPTLAFDGADTLHVVWAVRPRGGDRYVLRWARLPAGAPASAGTRGVLSLAGAAPTSGSASASAFAPALAIRGGRTLLAWMEGGDRDGVVKAGASREGLQAAADAAVVLSSPGANARDPEVGLDDDTLFAVWSESTSASFPELHATTLRCGGER